MDWKEASSRDFDYGIISSRTAQHVRDVDELSCGSYLVEKPISGDSTKFGQAWIEEFSSRVFVSAPLRQQHAYARLKEHMGSEIPLSASAKCLTDLRHWRPSRDANSGYWGNVGEGGVMRELIHEFDYLQDLLGSLTVLSSRLGRSRNFKFSAESFAELTLIARGGTRIRLDLSWDSKIEERSLKLAFRDHSVVWDVRKQTVSEGDSGRLFQGMEERTRDELFSRQLSDFFAGNPGSSLATLGQAISALRLIERAEEINKL